MAVYIEVPLMDETAFVYCRTLRVPKGTYFGGVTITPNQAGAMTIYLQALIFDETADHVLRHIHVEPLGHSFESEMAEFIGAGVLQTARGTFRFAVIELDIDENEIETQLSEDDLGITMPLPDISIEEYRKLFGSDNITITRDNDGGDG